MVRLIVAFGVCLVSLSSPLSSFGEVISRKSVALVYAGPGACEVGDCALHAGQIAEKTGLRVVYVTPKEINQSLFRGASLWIQPGGDGIEAAQALGPDKMNMIRDFIRKGGRYLGFCAGGFLADRFVDDEKLVPGLDMLPDESYDYKKTDLPIILPVNWLGEIRQMYFENGPAFKVPSPSQVEVISRYEDGSVAAMMMRFGRGAFAVTGPHPEAPESWFIEDKLEKPDGSDLHLAFDLLNRLMYSY